MNKILFFSIYTSSLLSYFNLDAQKLSANWYNSAFVCNDGTIWTCGINSSGSIGNGTTNIYKIPEQVRDATGTGYLTRMKQVAVGQHSMVAVRTDGTVWAWGRNSNGELGVGTNIDHTLPVQVKSPTGIGYLTNIKSVSATSGVFNASYALSNDGTVWSWGSNYKGKLGIGTTVDVNLPVQVKGVLGIGFLTGIIKISAGRGYCLALKNDGTVWAWGDNLGGAIGDGSTNDAKFPVQVKGYPGVPYLNNIVDISAGDTHSVALRNDKTVWAWGKNTNGELGDNTLIQRNTPVQVMGENAVGVLSNIIQIEAGEDQTYVIDNNNNVWAWGSQNNNFSNGTGQPGYSVKTPKKVKGIGGIGFLSNITEISSGQQHTIALSNNQVLGWGTGGYGGLGDGTGTDNTYPTTVQLFCKISTSSSYLPYNEDFIRITQVKDVVSIQNKSGLHISETVLIDILGRIIEQKYPNISESEVNFQLPILSNGVYIFVLKTGKGFYSQKIIVSK